MRLRKRCVREGRAALVVAVCNHKLSQDFSA